RGSIGIPLKGCLYEAVGIPVARGTKLEEPDGKPGVTDGVASTPVAEAEGCDRRTERGTRYFLAGAGAEEGVAASGCASRSSDIVAASGEDWLADMLLTLELSEVKGRSGPIFIDIKRGL